MRPEKNALEISQHGSQWIVRVLRNGIAQVFCCPTEQIALRFAAAFSLAAETMALVS